MSRRVRRFDPEDAQAVSSLIVRTLREVNCRDYPAEYIEETVLRMTPEDILRRAGWTHFYVISEGDRIVGCGAIGPYWDVPDEFSLFTIFVLPEYIGTGVGKLIMQTLEADEYFLHAKRVEIAASVTGCEFYRKFGYDYKNGSAEPDGEGLIRLEKHRMQQTEGEKR